MNQKYHQGPQPIWNQPTLQLFKKPVSVSPAAGSKFTWSAYCNIMYLGGAAIGLFLGTKGDGLFYIAASTLLGAALGGVMTAFTKKLFRKSYYPWMYLLLLCAIPFIIYLSLPMVMGALRAVLVVAGILLILAILGSLFG